MKKSICLAAILLCGCVSTQNVFTSLSQSEEVDYGYSKNNPILIGYYSNWQKNAELAIAYLSKLKYNGKPLQCILHATVEKPANQPRKKKPLFQSMYGAPTNLGGIFLNLYVMKTKGGSDTLRVYFDEEIKGEIKILRNLEFDSNQQNNIWR